MADEADDLPPAKKRRIGQRQRVALTQKHAETSQQSCLASFLVEKWAWGHLSPQMVQQIASAAKTDMEATGQLKAPKPLDRLARLGGGYDNMMSRDLIATAKVNLPEPFIVELPYKNIVKCQKLLLPHELFSCIYHHYPETFSQILVGPPGHLENFWAKSKHHPAMSMHPHLGDASKRIPVGVHGDGVPITGKGKIWSKSSWVFSWSSLLSQAATKDKQFFIGMVWDTLQGPTTMDTFHTVLAWSLKYLQQGIWPLEDWKGNQHLASHMLTWF